jgi:hypothetical protein
MQLRDDLSGPWWKRQWHKPRAEKYEGTWNLSFYEDCCVRGFWVKLFNSSKMSIGFTKHLIFLIKIKKIDINFLCKNKIFKSQPNI